MSTAAPNVLLSLPRELRDLIYLHSLHVTSPPPTRTHRTISPPGYNGQFYLWTIAPTWNPPTPLLLLNHQIRTETHSLLHQLQKSPSKIRFHLDILVAGYIYTPQWTLQNLALQHTCDLDVHLTILSTEAFRRSPHHHNNTAPGIMNPHLPTPTPPGPIFRALVNFLSRFLYHGPAFLHHDDARPTAGSGTSAASKAPDTLFIDTLTVRVSFRDPSTRATHPEAVREVFRTCKALSRLDGARRYLRKVRVEAEWVEGGGEEEERGVERRRVAEWEVQGEAEGDLLTEDDWAAMGFYFGEAWKARYGAVRVRR